MTMTTDYRDALAACLTALNAIPNQPFHPGRNELGLPVNHRGNARTYDLASAIGRVPAAPTEYTFTVTGSGPFPWLMLTTGRCWPHANIDAQALRRFEQRTIALTSERPLNVADWAEYGWTEPEARS